MENQGPVVSEERSGPWLAGQCKILNCINALHSGVTPSNFSSEFVNFSFLHPELKKKWKHQYQTLKTLVRKLVLLHTGITQAKYRFGASMSSFQVEKLVWQHFHRSNTHNLKHFHFKMGFPGDSEVKTSACSAGDLGLIPGSGRSPGEGNATHSSIFALENPMYGGAWWATVHGVAKNRTRLSYFTFTFHFKIKNDLPA